MKVAILTIILIHLIGIFWKRWKYYKKTDKHLQYLLSLRWDVDQLIKEPISGDYWWLRPAIKDGKRVGITDCCQLDYECPHHKNVRSKLEAQSNVILLS